MTGSEFPPASHFTLDVIAQLQRTNSIAGMPYPNILLSNKEEGMSDVYEANMVVDPQYASLYWPGSHPEHGGEFETIILTSTEPPPMVLAAEKTASRSAILGAFIGEAALSRVPPEALRRWKVLKDEIAPEPPILMATARCELFTLPLAVCQTSKVVQSRVAPVGARMMHLWCPSDISPKPVLSTLKKIIREVIKGEVI